jgi:hypothetical protein
LAVTVEPLVKLLEEADMAAPWRMSSSSLGKKIAALLLRKVEDRSATSVRCDADMA